MKRMCAVSAAVCFLSLAFASRSARADFDIDLTGGATVAIPTGRGDTFFGPRVGLGARWVFAENHALGLLARGHFLVTPRSEQDWNAAVSYRYFIRPSESVRFFGGLSVGAGVWPGCVQEASDYCGGLGAVLGGEAGVQLPLNEDAAFTAGLELIGQLGLPDVEGVMMMPGAWVGLAF